MELKTALQEHEMLYIGQKCLTTAYICPFSLVLLQMKNVF